MFRYQTKITRCIKRQKTHFKETQQASKPDSDKTGMLELSDHKVITTILNMLRALINKVDNVQE